MLCGWLAVCGWFRVGDEGGYLSRAISWWQSRPDSVLGRAINRMEWGEHWPTEGDVEELAAAVRVELELTPEMRRLRHAADAEFREERWEAAQALYAQALQAGHAKVVYLRLQKAICLVRWGDQLKLNEDGKKGKKFWKATTQQAAHSVSGLVEGPGSKFAAAAIVRDNRQRVDWRFDLAHAAAICPHRR